MPNRYAMPEQFFSENFSWNNLLASSAKQFAEFGFIGKSTIFIRGPLLESVFNRRAKTTFELQSLKIKLCNCPDTKPIASVAANKHCEQT